MKKKLHLLVNQLVWNLVFENEGDNNPPPPVPPPPPEDKKFSQKDVDFFLAEDRRKHKVQAEKTIQELEVLKKNKNLSEQEKTGLQARIEELQNQILTKEQLLEKEKNRLQSEHRTELQKTSEERETWKNRYTRATIEREISDSAVRHKAFSPSQIVDLLEKHTRLVEEADPTNNNIINYVPRVKFKDVDADGKPVTLDLTVDEAVKRMSELVDRFGNLFQSGVNSGLGGNGGVSGGGRTVDINRIKTVADYRKHRAEILKRK